jgi:hypothetical protein
VAVSNADSAAARCMSNHRQLVTAWQMYTSLNRNCFPPNGNGTGIVDSPSSATWCEGWLEWNASWPDNTNWQMLVKTGIATPLPFGSPASLGPYLGGAYQAFKCPSDIYNCREGAKTLPRVRSISMNGFIEGGEYGDSALGESTWYHGWRSYNNVSQLTRPSPADLIVTLDEHADSINDAWFIADVMNTATWEDVPGSYHDGALGASFADGHSELHHWQRAATRQPVLGIYINGVVSDVPGNLDISWLTNHLSTTLGP